MKPVPQQPVNIVGAGLAGALLAVLLARRGFPVHLYDRRPDPRLQGSERGRSINLALAARGISALEHAGVMEHVRPLLIPMRGRMVHDLSGATTLHPYGQREHEVIYSVGRAALNRVLIEEATRHGTITTAFETTCTGIALGRNVARFRHPSAGEIEAPLAPMVATDGAGSAVRQSLAAANFLRFQEDWLDHDYKELTIPAVNGRHALEPNALHIWPRGGFMLIALPNTDGSFTATLFLARQGVDSFATLRTREAIQSFFAHQFPDAVPLMPQLLDEFEQHPQGQLGTVHTDRWHVDGRVLLLGDAAHAIVPFHGQGMNAAFEDCLVLDTLLDQHDDWASLFDAVEHSRRPNTAAIAAMAIENYTEMRDTVLDPAFVRQKAIAMDLERRFPDRFIPRYSMVMFHPEIPYSEAQRRGAVQSRILAELDSQRTPNGDVDFALAQTLIAERLPRLP